MSSLPTSRGSARLFAMSENDQSNQGSQLTLPSPPPPPSTLPGMRTLGSAPSFSSAPSIAILRKKEHTHTSTPSPAPAAFPLEQEAKTRSKKKKKKEKRGKRRSHRSRSPRPSRSRSKESTRYHRRRRSPSTDDVSSSDEGSTLNYHRQRSSNTSTKGPLIQNTNRSNRQNDDQYNSLYYYDRQGDRNNLTYESMYKYDVPRYRTREVRTVLGAPLFVRTIKGSHGEVSNLEISKNMPSRSSKISRYTDYADQFRISTSSSSAAPVSIEITKNEANLEENDYIKLQFDTPMSNAIVTRTNTDLPSTIDPMKEKLIQLEQHVQNYPYDVDGWLRRIAFQDEQLSWPSNRKATTRHTLLEVKLSIYEKALENCPDNERLLIGYMKGCEALWETPRLLNEWEQILKTHPSHLQLWIEYLNLYQHRFQVFSVTSCLQAYEQCITTFRQLLWEHPQVKEDLELSFIRIFQRACQLLFDSGYTERAISCYQAMIELSFFSLTEDYSIESNWKRLLKQFEYYWEQSYPRIGDRKARGWWKHFEEIEEEEEEEESNSDSNDNYIKDTIVKDNKTIWIHQEQQLEVESLLPLHDLSKSTQDPFRMVMFEDIQSLLFPPLMSSVARSRLITGLTSLLGFYHCQPGLSSSDLAVLDPYLHSEYKDLMDMTSKSSDCNTNNDRNSNLPISNYPQSIFSMDNGKQNSYPSLSIIEFYRCCLWQLAPFIRDIHGYAILITLLPVDDILLLLDTLKVSHLMDELGRVAYQSIKTRLALSSIDKIYRMAYEELPQEVSLSKEWWSIAPSLHSLVKTVLSMGQEQQAFNILMCMAIYRDQPITREQRAAVQWTPIQQLKARKMYDLSISSHLLVEHSDYLGDEQTIGIVGCITLFEYFTHGISSASRIYQQVFDLLEDVGLETQLYLIHQSICTLYRPADFRHRLDVALTLFPHNTYLLSAYLMNETKFKIENRLRRSLDSLIHLQSSHWLWMFSIYAELRYQPGNYNVYRVRNLFDQAIEDSSGATSASLWTLYILFELQQNNTKRANQLFLRAIRACPWHKRIYLLAYTVLNNTLEDSEVSETLDLMMEKEIRLRSLPE
ncbi:NRDE-2, necessary for RNA interference-domain-containing protein [Syncephalis fuscata]|nr:NRDE-2, necessary for RNA interference-domain-containing protein [Syncephalis fuscata]